MTPLGRKPIQDELTGKGTPAWRFFKRKQKEDVCQRCYQRVPPDDVRVSWKSGVKEMVKRRVCSLCVAKEMEQENRVREKLYPTKEASK